jgi:hypothetical protein
MGCSDISVAPKAAHLRISRQHIAFYACFGAITLAALALLYGAGALQIGTTTGDEVEHFRRVLAAAVILRGDVSTDNLASLYSQGIWPPFYPMLLGGLNAVLGLSLYGLRVLNVLFAVSGVLLMTATLPVKVRWAALPVLAAFLTFNPYYFQIRPENLVLLLTGAVIFIAATTHVFGEAGTRPNNLLYAALGVLTGLLCLTHAAFALPAVYFAVLSLLLRKGLFAYLPALFATVAPYLIIQNLMHAGLVVFATTSPESLARASNPFFDDQLSYEENFEAAVPALFAEMRRRMEAGDFVRFPRPRLVPASHYETWLRYENKRRIFGDIARETLSKDPGLYFERMGLRLGALSAPTLCRPEDPYACKIAPLFVVKSAYIGFGVAAIASFIILLFAERHFLFTAFTFLGLAGSMLGPMVIVTGQWRQFMIVPLVLIFGALYRWSDFRAILPRLHASTQKEPGIS